MSSKRKKSHKKHSKNNQSDETVTRKRLKNENLPEIETFEEMNVIETFMEKYFSFSKVQLVLKDNHISSSSLEDAYMLLSTKNKDNYLQAWKYFNTAVCMAVTCSQQLAQAFAHRAEFLLMIKKCYDCLTDCNRLNDIEDPDPDVISCCVFYGYKCYDQMQIYRSQEECEYTFQQFLQLPCQRKVLKEILQKRIMNVMPNLPKYTNQLPSCNRKVLASKMYIKKFNDYANFQHQENLPCASTAIEMVIGHKGSRHFVATRDIEPGEIIMIEGNVKNSVKPILKDTMTLCDHCQHRYWSFHPCEGCASCQYCSETCRMMDWNSYHQWECEVIPMTTNSGYRYIFRFFIELINRAGGIEYFEVMFGNDDTWLDLNDENIRKDTTLVKNVRLNTSYDGPEIQFACETAYLLATRSEFLGSVFEKVSPLRLFKVDEVKRIAAYLLRSIYVYIANACVFQTYSPRSSIQENQTFAVYPYGRYFSHSCAPNASYFTGKLHEMIVFAKHPIPKGTEVTISHIYNTHADMKTEDRQKRLKEYEFTECSCKACKENWNPSNLKTLKDILKKKPKVFKEISTKINETYAYLENYCENNPKECGELGLPYEIIPKMAEVLKMIHSKATVRCLDYEFFFSYITRTFIANFGNMVDDEIPDNSEFNDYAISISFRKF